MVRTCSEHLQTWQRCSYSSPNAIWGTQQIVSPVVNHLLIYVPNVGPKMTYNLFLKTFWVDLCSFKFKTSYEFQRSVKLGFKHTVSPSFRAGCTRQSAHLLVELHMDDNAEMQAWTSALRQVVEANKMGANANTPSKDEQEDAWLGRCFFSETCFVWIVFIENEFWKWFSCELLFENVSLVLSLCDFLKCSFV